MRADTRFAVTSAAGPVGQAVRSALAERRVPIETLKLLDRASDEAIISEYAGAPILIGALEDDSLEDRDVVFVCGGDEEGTRCLTLARGNGALLVDLSGAAGREAGSPVIGLTVNAAVLDGAPATVGAPHAIALALASAIAPIDATWSVEQASAVVLRPVSDFGELGIEELHRQTISLMNFTDIPKQIFGRQLAFNVIADPAAHASAEETALAGRISRETGAILGWSEPRLAVRLLIAPIFHGHAAFVHVRTRERLPLSGLGEVLAGSPGLTARSARKGPFTPVETTEAEAGLVAEATLDGVGDHGLWLSLVGAHLRESAAENAVEIAGRLRPGSLAPRRRSR